jgi:hypothetical protein
LALPLLIHADPLIDLFLINGCFKCGNNAVIGVFILPLTKGF